LSTKNSALAPKKTTAGGTAAAGAITYATIKNVLQKNTCLSCHHPTKRQVGPSYAEVAKRKYSVAQIMSLIRNPKPENWPDFSTPMAPMPQVSSADSRKIAEYIKSLEKK
jgi:cytochrome c551/c552